jgi:hypothetical protein
LDHRRVNARRRLAGPLAVALVAAATTVTGPAAAPPAGRLPAGPTATLLTQKGELVAVALPHRTAGRVWRIARSFDTHVIRQVSEADVGASVVLVFRATGRGNTTLAFGLTVRETTTAHESRRLTVRVR